MPAPSKDYIPVRDRLAAARADIAELRTSAPVMIDDRTGYVQCILKMQDGRVFFATAAFELYTGERNIRGWNPIETAETSAIGRALAHAGYEVTPGPSQEEMDVAEERKRRNT
jgi:hypothetical protein